MLAFRLLILTVDSSTDGRRPFSAAVLPQPDSLPGTQENGTMLVIDISLSHISSPEPSVHRPSCTEAETDHRRRLLHHNRHHPGRHHPRRTDFEKSFRRRLPSGPLEIH